VLAELGLVGGFRMLSPRAQAFALELQGFSVLPFQQTTDLVEKLRTQKVAFEELIIPDEIHDLLRWSDWIRAYRANRRILRPQIGCLGRTTISPLRRVAGALLRHPAVQEVAIAGMPDERCGEAPHAFVVLKAGATATETELRNYARDHLAHFKCRRKFTSHPSCFRQERFTF
jgi:AMP-binding enzyme C-terminal domain